jgi:methionyl-tRNA synthetase
LPKSSQKIWSQLGLEGNVSDISWNEMSELKLKAGHKIGTVEPIFSKVESSDIEKEQSKLGN